MSETRSLKGYVQEATAMGTLLGMLSTCRPAGSKAEKHFIRAYIAPLGAKPDGKGNYVLRIGEDPVMWSCHTDTVHDKSGVQALKRIGNFTIGVADPSTSSCLGADDTAGVWLMREMILAKKPGLYVFHRSEEVGCVGSKWLAKNNPELLSGIKFAIALDRKGKQDVITHQMGRCCSDEFAESLAAQLEMNYKPSPLGVYTDTKSYTGLIGECTNISVGYYAQHTSNETLDAEFLAKLRLQLLKIDVSKLVEKRKPGEVEAYDYSDWSGYGGYYSSGGGYSGGVYEDFVSGYWDKDTNKWVDGYFKRRNQAHGEFSCWAEFYDEYYGTDKFNHRDLAFNPTRRTPEQNKALAIFNGDRGSNVTDFRKDVTPRHVRYGDPLTQSEIDQIVDTTYDVDAEDFSVRNARMTLENLVRNHPEEVADYLEQYGMDPADIAAHIHDVLGYVKTK